MNLSAKKWYVPVLALVSLIVACGFVKLPDRHDRNYYESRGEIVWEVPMTEKLIALTFDDGPNPITTPEILDLLKKYDAKATFFVVGNRLDRYPNVVMREAAEGHEVANHTYNHLYFNRKIGPSTITDEILKNRQKIKALTGQTSPWFRPPGGFYSDLIVNTAKKNGYTVVLWSWHQDTKDWIKPGTNKIVSKVLNNARNGDIVLLHDHVEGSTQTVEALNRILPELKKRGFQFVTVSELLNYSNLKSVKK